jgi:predicted nucleic acid-binding protein
VALSGAVSSELIAVESARTIDRLRIQGSLTTEEAVKRIRVVNEWLEAIDLVLLRPPVLSRASEPMPMPIGTIDAIHLATALIWRDRLGPLPEMATHETALGAAARTFGFNVRGT